MKTAGYYFIRNTSVTLLMWLIITASSIGATPEGESNNPVKLGFSYTGDIILNLAGGIKTGIGYTGLGSLTAEFLTEDGRMWKGGEVRMKLSCSHGRIPSATLTGDLQGISNIAAGNHLFMQELYFRQTIGKWKLTLGLQDMNAEFVTLPSAGAFMNSSFGIPPLLTGNHPVPVFPLTALGISLACDISDRIAVRSAVFDGNPLAFEQNPYNLYWTPTQDHGMLITCESEFRTGSIERPGSVKAGVCYHTGIIEKDLNTGDPVRRYAHETSMYLLAETLLFKTDEKNFTGFSQVAFSPDSQTPFSYYTGVGVRVDNLMPSISCDEAGIALAHTGIRECLHACETAFEFYCRFSPGRFCYLQPDLQYIIHPSGTDKPLHNTVVLLIRAGIDFPGN